MSNMASSLAARLACLAASASAAACALCAMWVRTGVRGGALPAGLVGLLLALLGVSPVLGSFLGEALVLLLSLPRQGMGTQVSEGEGGGG